MEDIIICNKECCRCHLIKPFSEFNKCKSGKFGLHGYCRDCQRKFRREWYLENREKELSKQKTPESKAKISAKNKEKYWKDEKFREEILANNRIRRRKESARIKARLQRKKWLESPHNRIGCVLRNRIRAALNGLDKMESTEALLGCSFEDGKKHIESLFQEGMNWDNYGDKWHIDHIVPCDFFDFSKTEHQYICFNYRNLQPLWADKNKAKSNKITIDNVEEFINEIRKNIKFYSQMF